MRQYLRILRAHRLLVVGSLLVCTIAAAALAWLRTPVYTAQTQLFVAANGTVADPGVTYQGGLFSEERVLSYVQMVSSPAVLDAVIKELHLPGTSDDLAGRIEASVPTGTVLLNISVHDPSPTRAAAIARALSSQFTTFISRLETAPGASNSRVTVSVTSPARVPTSPTSPQKKVYLAFGVILGLVLGVGAAFLREAFGRRVLDEEDAAIAAGAPVLGNVAEVRGRRRPSLVMTAQPFSARAEAYRRLRANLEGLAGDRELGAFVVSSAGPHEGKTVVAANLAVAFAQSGHRVVIVDVNLRRPKLAELFGRSSSVGVANVVRSSLPVVSVLQSWSSNVPLTIVASGPDDSDPSDLIGSPRFDAFLDDLRERFEVVILDAPSLLESTDAAVLARKTSGAVLVARPGSTRADDLTLAAESLRAAAAATLGVVLNRRVARDRTVGVAPGRSRRARRAGSGLDSERVSALKG